MHPSINSTDAPDAPSPRQSQHTSLSVQASSQPQSQPNSVSGVLHGAPDDPQQTGRPQAIELPGHFEDVLLDDLVILIADLLERMIAHNDQIPLSAEGLTRFHSRSSPAISIVEYLRRIIRYIRVERSVLLLMLHSIDQICARRPSFNISSLSVHRFIIASITILSKAFCDAFAPNPQFAKVGGVSLIELNLLEREFLSHMEWRLACTREVLHAYYVKLVRTHSSGRYVVPDTSPRPLPIDTLPSDQIEWNVSNIPNAHEGLQEMASNSAQRSMSEDESDSSSDEDEMLSSPPVMATDARPAKGRIPSRTASSAANSPSVGSSHGRRGSYRPSSSATLEQNMAFAEMRSGRRLTPSTSSNPGTSVMNTARSPALGYNQSVRSPIVGRRRRRSSNLEEAASTPGPSPQIDIDIEGILRGSRRRRLHTEGDEVNDSLDRNVEGDRRMEIGPNET